MTNYATIVVIDFVGLLLTSELGPEQTISALVLYPNIGPNYSSLELCLDSYVIAKFSRGIIEVGPMSGVSFYFRFLLLFSCKFSFTVWFSLHFFFHFLVRFPLFIILHFYFQFCLLAFLYKLLTFFSFHSFLPFIYFHHT